MGSGIAQAFAQAGVTVRPIVGKDAKVETASGVNGLPPSLANLTLDQALDAVAESFGGVVSYGACGADGLVSVKFTDIRAGKG